MRLVLATRNAHKAREFGALLAPHTIEALPEDVELPPETGATFVANALGKARAAASAARLKDCRRHSAAKPGCRVSGTQICTGRKPAARRASRCFFTRSAVEGVLVAMASGLLHETF